MWIVVTNISEWYRNYQRNRKLIDLEYTPEELQSEILEQFNNQDKWAQRGSTSIPDKQLHEIDD